MALQETYDQISIRDIEKENQFYQILSPDKNDQGVWIHQDAWFSIGKFENNIETSYHIHKEGNGLYLFILEGSVEVAGESLNDRDGIGIWDVDTITLKALSDSRVLLMEVPM